jgi:hypothetical protein
VCGPPVHQLHLPDHESRRYLPLHRPESVPSPPPQKKRVLQAPTNHCTHVMQPLPLMSKFSYYGCPGSNIQGSIYMTHRTPSNTSHQHLNLLYASDILDFSVKLLNVSLNMFHDHTYL